MNFYKNIIAGLLICILALLMSCNDYKGNCYYCYAQYGHFGAIKGLDTVFFYASSKLAISDSTGHYLNAGYRIDTLSIITEPYPAFGDNVCGSQRDSLVAQGDTCAIN